MGTNKKHNATAKWRAASGNRSQIKRLLFVIIAGKLISPQCRARRPSADERGKESGHSFKVYKSTITECDLISCSSPFPSAVSIDLSLGRPWPTENPCLPFHSPIEMSGRAFVTPCAFVPLECVYPRALSTVFELSHRFFCPFVVHRQAKQTDYYFV